MVQRLQSWCSPEPPLRITPILRSHCHDSGDIFHLLVQFLRGSITPTIWSLPSKPIVLNRLLSWIYSSAYGHSRGNASRWNNVSYYITSWKPTNLFVFSKWNVHLALFTCFVLLSPSTSLHSFNKISREKELYINCELLNVQIDRCYNYSNHFILIYNMGTQNTYGCPRCPLPTAMFFI